MREIDVSAPGRAPRTTVLSYGALRSGKTRWAASWPRPLFFSDNTESGWTTITNMNPNVFWEPDRVPRVWAIEKVADMMQAAKDVEPLIQRGEIQTVVIDSLTFYNDLLLDFLTANAAQGNRMPDMRRVYGTLGNNLRALRVMVHNLPVNVLWLCLEKPPGEDSPFGQPMISGQQSIKFAAGCDYILYHRAYHDAQQGLLWEIRTRRWAQYPAGGRDEGTLPDPLGYWQTSGDPTVEDYFVLDCTYRCFAESLGLPSYPVAQPQSPVGVARAQQPVGKATATR